MKLYSLPLSPYSARVRGAIYAKQLDIEIIAAAEGLAQVGGVPRRSIPHAACRC